MARHKPIIGHLADQIHGHMEVLGSDGKHIGTVDYLEGAGKIKLMRVDPNAGGKDHFISYDWVDHVDQRVHLNKTYDETMQHWQDV